MNEKAAYWVEIAEYDLETARAMLDTKRFLYVAFMCHQVAEKVLKACIVDVTGEVPPYTHNLRRLADESGIYGSMSDEQKDLLDALEPLNIEARYPTCKESLSRRLDQEFSESLLRETERLYRWIRGKLSST